MKYKIDSMNLKDNRLTIDGWAIPSESKAVEYQITDQKGRNIEADIEIKERPIVASAYKADRMCGFTAELDFNETSRIVLLLKDGSNIKKIKINNKVIERKNSVKKKKIDKLIALCNAETFNLAYEYYKENGIKAVIDKVRLRLNRLSTETDYSDWYEKTLITAEELEMQRNNWRELEFDQSYPKFSIVIPTYNTPEKYLRMLYDSIKAQTYPIFEVIIADGSEKNHTEVERITAEYSKADDRFIYSRLEKNLGIADNTNAGLKLASGDYIVLCDHDDELTPYALYEVAKAISINPCAEFIYTDEDKVDFEGKTFFEPHFKSDFNIELLNTVNYFCHLSVIKRELLEKIGGFRNEYDGAQDYDLFLRCAEELVKKTEPKLDKYRAYVMEKGFKNIDNLEKCISEIEAATGLSAKAVKELTEGRFTSEFIVHIPKVCYHWRCHNLSTAADPSAKLYAFEAGKKAISDHYKRSDIDFGYVDDGVTYGFYHTKYTDKAGNIINKLYEENGKLPKLSILIPNKDHIEDLDKCIRSIVLNSNYRNLEFIVIENNSTEDKTFEYYNKIENNPVFYLLDENGTAVEEHKGIEDIAIKVVYWKGEFNYSAINNFGAKAAEGKYLLLLNNDVELIDPDSLLEMYGLLRRKDIGIVGARLLYEDDTIQHAGVVVGIGGIAGAVFVGAQDGTDTYMHRMMCTQDYSSVTAACLMTKREAFDTVGGLTEELKVAFNDIDYCMKVRKLGLRCVYDPYVTFHHYESKSRGLEDTPEKIKRFNSEIVEFASRWGEILENGDPYYNPNLSLGRADFGLRNVPDEKIGEPFKLDMDIEKQLEAVLLEKEKRENAITD
ncbi:MAG: glycosyltransferase [Eubacteriales bacterium]|nr:glycosyltransferase [Eubacteriales bacterium]